MYFTFSLSSSMSSENINMKPFTLTSFDIAESKRSSVCLNSGSVIGYYLAFLTHSLDAGYAFALFLDRRHRPVRMITLKKSGKPIPKPIIEAIDSELEDKRIKYFLVAHNHKNKPLIPSPDDIKTTDFITERYADSSAKFIGHYITSGFDYLILTYDGQIDRCYLPRRRTDYEK